LRHRLPSKRLLRLRPSNLAYCVALAATVLIAATKNSGTFETPSGVTS